MVDYFFDDEEKQKKLKGILDEWLHTPFRHHCGVKGLGCDCIHFVVRVCQEFEMLQNLVVPDYPRDWHLHNTRELLTENIEQRLKVQKRSLSNPINGDIILSHYGKASSHSGIFFDGYVYQALNGIGIRKINFNDIKFKKRMKYIYRILA